MPDPVAPPGAVAEPGFHLVVAPHGRVFRSARIPNAPRRYLQAPFLTPGVLGQLRKPMRELVLDVLGRDGHVLDSIGWPWIGEAFHDRRRPEDGGGVRTGRIEIVETLRVLRVPVSPQAVFLLFSETEAVLTIRSTLEIARHGSSLYSIVARTPAPPPLPEFAPRLEVRALPGPRRLDRH